MKLVQVIYDNRTFQDKNGVTRKQKMFFLEMDNEKRIAIQPCFKEGYVLFDAYALVEHNDSARKPSNKPVEAPVSKQDK